MKYYEDWEVSEILQTGYPIRYLFLTHADDTHTSFYPKEVFLKFFRYYRWFKYWKLTKMNWTLENYSSNTRKVFPLVEQELGSYPDISTVEGWFSCEKRAKVQILVIAFLIIYKYPIYKLISKQSMIFFIDFNIVSPIEDNKTFPRNATD